MKPGFGSTIFVPDVDCDSSGDPTVKRRLNVDFGVMERLFIPRGGVPEFGGDSSLLEGTNPILINRGLSIWGQQYLRVWKSKVRKMRDGVRFEARLIFHCVFG